MINNIAFCDTKILNDLSQFTLDEYIALCESLSHQDQDKLKELVRKQKEIELKIKNGNKKDPYWFNDKKKLEQELSQIEDNIEVLKTPKIDIKRAYKIGIIFQKKYKDWKFVYGAYEKLSINKKPNVIMVLPDCNISFELDENKSELETIVVPSDYSDWNKTLRTVIDESDALILIIDKKGLDETFSGIVTLIKSSKKPFREYSV